jgi:sugar lactone lactonase YvrE
LRLFSAAVFVLGCSCAAFGQATSFNLLISTLAGGMLPPTAASGTLLSIPITGPGIAVDPGGNTYFASASLNAVFKVDMTGVVTRVAGIGGANGFSGDGGGALSAQFAGPASVALDAAGNVYVSDSGNARIRKVDTSGNITTVAGSGNFGFSGDGGQATGARLSTQTAVATDAAGNLYITDVMNARIRKVNTAGIITTVAGSGTQGYSGDNGPAVSAALRSPSEVAVDGAGNLYIADRGNSRIRKVNAAGIITTVAGTGTSGYTGDGGPAADAEVSDPGSLALDAAGDLFLTDDENQVVREVSVSGIIETIVGNGVQGYTSDGGPATGASLFGPCALGLDVTGALYIAECESARIRKVSASGIIGTLVGGNVRDGGPAPFGALNQPSAVVRDNAGNTYVADSMNNRVREITAAGVILTVAGTGVTGYSGDGGPAINARLNLPQGLALDAAGNLYIADTENFCIRKVNTAGIISTVMTQRWAPYGIAVDGSGNLFIADPYQSLVQKASPSGALTTVAGTGVFGYSGDGGPAISAQLSEPFAVAVDAAGDVYIADTFNFRIRMVSPGGIITTAVGTGIGGESGDGGPAASARINQVYGLAFDAAGDLYIADTYDNRIRVVTNGTITAVAGNGQYNYWGDGGPAFASSFRYPWAVAVDASGIVAVADQQNNAIRLLAPMGTKPLITVQSAHTGEFSIGSTGAFTLTVTDAPESAPTIGVVTVTENPPPGFTVASMSGIGWICGAIVCASANPMSGGSFQPIAVTVNVGPAAAPQATNLVSVSGGGGPAAGAADLVVIHAPLSITAIPALPAATYGVAYSQTLGVVGGTPPYGWSLVSGSLTPGLTLSSAGAISGAPAITGSFGFTAKVTDGAGAAASAVFTLAVSAPASCAYGVYPGGQAFPASGGTGSIAITAGAGCPWNISNTLSWVTVTSATSGAGNGTVTYQAAANSGPAQSGSLTVADIPFTVQEAGATAAGMVAAGSMAQISCGGAWNTTITLVNTGAAPAEVVLNFFGDAGSPLPLPLVFPQVSSTAVLLASTLDRTIGAGAQLVIQTAGTASQTNVEGWAQALANGAIGGEAVFAASTSIGTQESVSPLETRNPSAFFLPFNYTSGYQTGIAIANLSNQTVNVPVALRGANGTSLGPVAPIQLKPYAHNSFMLATNYPAVANLFGSMELDTPTGGQISALGIRAAPDGALTTAPVFASTDASNGTMAQLVSGGTWNITLTLENTSATTAAQATLSFFDDNGNPLQLPLTYPLSGSATARPASSVTQTIEPEAQVVIATAGSTGTTTTEGWAQLTVTGASVGGSEVYADTSAGIVQEAAVGVETRNPPTGFLLPFNYTNGYTTGIAVANLTNQAVTIPVALKDDQGNGLGTASIHLGPYGHESFMLATNYPAVANHFGTLELDQPTGSPATAQISAIGLRATPGNAITSVPVLAK